MQIYASPYEIPISATQAHPSSNSHEVLQSALSDQTVASMEAEQEIYKTPCEGEGNTGLVYCVPSSNEQKIYEEFEGKRFRKLYHKEIM